MPLTLDEQEKVQAAKLEKIVFDIMITINDGDHGAFTNLRQELLDMALDIEVPMELRYRAKEAHDTASMDMTNAGLAQMTAIADSISSAGSGLRSAIRAAETGKAELFFPSLAASVAKAVVTFETFINAAENLQNELQAAGKEDLPGKIAALVETAKEIKGSLG